MAGVRHARFEDAPALAKVEVETWRATYPGMVADSVLLNMSERRKTVMWARELVSDPRGVKVWSDGGAGILGFGHCGPQRDRALAYDGEVTMLYVLPDAQGMGIGKHLLTALFEQLADRDCRSALIWVVKANPSRFFYERMGGRLALERRIVVGGEPVDTLGYGWNDLPSFLGRKVRTRNRSAGPSPES